MRQADGGTFGRRWHFPAEATGAPFLERSSIWLKVYMRQADGGTFRAGGKGALVARIVGANADVRIRPTGAPFASWKKVPSSVGWSTTHVAACIRPTVEPFGGCEKVPTSWGKETNRLLHPLLPMHERG